MKRLILFAAVQMLLGAAWAQTQKDPVKVTFDASPCGKFVVDGQPYSVAATFIWPLYSTHTYQSAGSYPISSDISCGDPAVSGVLGELHQVYVSDTYLSDAAVPSQTCAFFPKMPGCDSGQHVIGYVDGTATIGLGSGYYYKVSVVLTTPWSTPVIAAPACLSTCYGVTVNGQCYTGRDATWLARGASVQVQATPAPKFAFKQWVGDLQSYGGGPSEVIANLQGPLVIRPVFSWATPVVITTDPPNMKVMVDRTILTQAPCADDHSLTFYWGAGTAHALSPVSPQVLGGSGDMWVFDSWSDGGDQNRILTVPSAESVSLTLKYSPGSRVGFGTVPGGLKLTIDGRSNWTNYNFLWPLNSKHKISAPLQQTMKGRAYSFNRWTIGGPADQDFTVPPTGQQPATNAIYDLLGQLQVQSVPPGLTLTVDGKPCVTPCTIDRKAGTTVKVSAPASVAVDANSRLDFQGWTGGGTGERVWTASTSLDVMKANYVSSYRVQLAADPAGSGTFQAAPASADGFYAAGTNLTVAAQANPGYKFNYWADNSLESPLSATLSLNIAGPVAMKAAFEEIAFVAGVANAAGETPEAVVAPGSIVIINGHKLAAQAQVGPDSPLAQAVGGVVVEVTQRLLPLFSVAPEQIKAQLPSDLGEGQQTLTVHQSGQPDVSAVFTVKRNAPGLFTAPVDGQAFAMALHADGTAVTTDKPAQHGETITLLGTGFGPTRTRGLDGFVLPEGFDLPLVDAVEIRVGDNIVLQPDSVKAAVGYVGMTAVRLKIGDQLPSNATVEVRAAVKVPDDPEGKTFRESNKVLLTLK